MHIIDTHCHLDVADFDADRKDVLDRCRKTGIQQIVVPAIKQAGWQNLLNLCHAEAGLYPALGLHPVFINEHKPEHLDELDRLLAEKKQVVAVGEIGLDYYLKELDRDLQKQYFVAQLEIAGNHDLPVILHVRKAHDDILSTLKKHRVKGGVSHAFNGSLQQAKQYIELGFKLGFGGTLTYEGSKKIHTLAKELPLESIVLETDAPDMVVASHRGERNSPEYLVQSFQVLADLRGIDPDELAKQTTQNAKEVLSL